MVETNKNENFDDSFAEDDFAFLEEDEIKPTPATPVQAPLKNAEAAAKLPMKWLIIAGGVVIVGVIVFSVFHNKPAQDPMLTETTTKKIKPTKSEKTEQTITLPVQPQPATNTQNNATNMPANTHSEAQPTVKEEAKPSNTDHSQPKATEANANPATTNTNGSSTAEKSRDDMADLFAATTEQPKNLENALAEQNKKPAADKSIQNMDLYFGKNIPNNRIERHSNNTANDDVTIELSKQTSHLQQAVDSISQEMTENVNHLKQLEAKLNEMNKTLAKVNQNIGAMDARILGVTETVDSITQDVSHVKKIIADEDLDIAASSSKNNNTPDLTYKPPGYSIHAIIPGRAWLKSSSGQIITVAEGDVIGDYGTVAVIDAANNIVRTSSGVSFR